MQGILSPALVTYPVQCIGVENPSPPLILLDSGNRWYHAASLGIVADPKVLNRPLLGYRRGPAIINKIGNPCGGFQSVQVECFQNRHLFAVALEIIMEKVEKNGGTLN